MKIIDRFFCGLMSFCIFLSKLMLIAMVMIMCVSVFYRYVLNSGIRWSDEVAMLLMVWFGFISVAYGVQHKLHISVELFYGMMPAKVQWACVKVINLMVCYLGVTVSYYGVKLMQSTMNNVMTATKWPASTLYAALPIAGVLIAYFSFTDLIGYPSGQSNSDAINKEETISDLTNCADANVDINKEETVSDFNNNNKETVLDNTKGGE